MAKTNPIPYQDYVNSKLQYDAKYYSFLTLLWICSACIGLLLPVVSILVASVSDTEVSTHLKATFFSYDFTFYLALVRILFSIHVATNCTSLVYLHLQTDGTVPLKKTALSLLAVACVTFCCVDLGFSPYLSSSLSLFAASFVYISLKEASEGMTSDYDYDILKPMVQLLEAEPFFLVSAMIHAALNFISCPWVGCSQPNSRDEATDVLTKIHQFYAMFHLAFFMFFVSFIFLSISKRFLKESECKTVQ
jgi:hypothetical protein